jgi:hypothetical protein
MTYPSISIDKVDQEIHRFEQTPMAQPAVQQQQQQAAVTGTTSPVVPPQRQVTPPAQNASSPQAPAPDLSGMVSNVTSNFADMQKQMPEPQLPVNDGLKILGGLGLLAAGGLGLNKLLSEKEPTSVKPGSIESRKIGAGPQMNVDTSEPRMVGGLFPADVSTKPIAQNVSSVKSITESERLGEEARILREELERVKNNIENKYPFLKDQNIIPAPETPTVPLGTEVGKAPKEMPMIEKAAGTPEKKAVAEGRKQTAIVPLPSQPSLMTGSGMPAYQGTGPKGAKLSTNIPSLANLPEDKVFVPGGQYMDIIRNATGQEAYTENLKKYGYPVTPQQGYETGRKINEGLGRPTREEAKAAGAALGEPTKAITEKVNKIKMVKVGGVAGALISLTDLAKADTLRQGLGDVAEGLMPMGIAPSQIAPSTLTEKQLNAYREAQKLGSPYRSVPPPR